jgi:hypothetical protein
MDAEVIIKTRIRKIPKSFTWIDHRFVNNGFIETLTQQATLFYFFLTAVGDRNGLSYWGEEKLCKLLKMGMTELLAARSELENKDLIAYRAPIYQVLSLPKRPRMDEWKGVVNPDGLSKDFVQQVEMEVREEFVHHFGHCNFNETVLRNRVQKKIDEYLAEKKILG